MMCSQVSRAWFTATRRRLGVLTAFLVRSGNAGLVGVLDGTLRQSAIVERGWTVFADAIVGKDGLVWLTTAPFGGVFYPVEVAFKLL